MSFNFLHNVENERPCNELNLSGASHNNVEDSVPNKSKLKELKQLSVEKLATLKQKIIDTKNQTLKESLQCHGRYTRIYRKTFKIILNASREK